MMVSLRNSNGGCEVVKITDMTSCTFEQALTVWNKGFEGYFSNMTMTMDKFIARFSHEGLSPELSVVAWDDDTPIGFIVSGIRNVRGKVIAWNGGTGVVPAYRGRGVGRRMMELCLDMYRRHGVDIAYLEAVVENASAITLYERVGYRVIDRVAMVHRMGTLNDDAFLSTDASRYTTVTGLPQEVANLEFYQAFSPWQAQWPSVTGGKSVILYDAADSPMAYALYKHWLNDSGEIVSMVLYQCEARPDVPDKEGIIQKLVREVYSPVAVDCRRLTVNVRTSNETLMNLLRTEGFTTHFEQLFMGHDLNR